MAGGRYAVGFQRAALDGTVPYDAVVAADHAAQYGAGVGRNVAVDDEAVADGSVVVESQHRRVVGKLDVGSINGHIVDLSRRSNVGKQAGIIVAQRQTGDFMAVSIHDAGKAIGGVANGFGSDLIGGGQI